MPLTTFFFPQTTSTIERIILKKKYHADKWKGVVKQRKPANSDSDRAN